MSFCNLLIISARRQLDIIADPNNNNKDCSYYLSVVAIATRLGLH